MPAVRHLVACDRCRTLRNEVQNSSGQQLAAVVTRVSPEMPGLSLGAYYERRDAPLALDQPEGD
jgi:hypothetical protein